MTDDYTWRRATGCGESGQCVEVAELPEAVAVRDSKNPGGGVLVFDQSAWRRFVGDVRAGNFDR